MFETKRNRENSIIRHSLYLYFYIYISETNKND